MTPTEKETIKQKYSEVITLQEYITAKTDDNDNIVAIMRHLKEFFTKLNEEEYKIFLYRFFKNKSIHEIHELVDKKYTEVEKYLKSIDKKFNQWKETVK